MLSFLLRVLWTVLVRNKQTIEKQSTNAYIFLEKQYENSQHINMNSISPKYVYKLVKCCEKWSGIFKLDLTVLTSMRCAQSRGLDIQPSSWKSQCACGTVWEHLGAHCVGTTGDRSVGHQRENKYIRYMKLDMYITSPTRTLTWK